MSALSPLESSDHVDGPADAELELVMYGDFQCPYCIAAHPIVGRVRERLSGRLRFGFRHFPLRDIHPLAEEAAQASEAAAAQGEFWAYYELLYGSRGKIEHADLLTHASAASLELPTFESALDSNEFAARVARDVDSGEASGISGTPAFFVNGRRHDGSFDAGSLVSALEAPEA